MKLHSNWRDCQAWKSEGLSFSTTSDRAVKLYDAALTQYVGWYDDDSTGGIEKTASDLIQADPNFAMGRVLSIGLDLMGTARTVRTDPQFRQEIEDLVKMSESVNEREKRHIQAVTLWSEGRCKSAALVWEDILSDYPTDMLALKFAHDNYFYFGQQSELRDSIARVMPSWKSDIPLYGYLMGMYSFGLCETNMLEMAEPVAKKGLEINAQDAWSTHSLAHVYEMQGRSKEGLTFMSTTVNDWEKCGMLACHNYWHWALYHIERNEHQAAVDIFDNEISKRCESGAMLDIVDAASILYRLEMEGIEVGSSRWEPVYEVCRSHQDEHVTAFNDIHLLMAYLGAKKPQLTTNLLQSIKEYVTNYLEEDNGQATKTIGLPLCEALLAYDSGDYDEAVRLLLPIRYNIVNIGGSNAQRDIFNLLLVNAACRSKHASYQNLCRNLIYERKAQKTDSPMSERLLNKWLAKHGH